MPSIKQVPPQSPTPEAGKSRDEKPRLFYGWIIVSACLLITAMGGGIQYSFGVFFKPLLSEFGWTRAMISGAFSLYTIIHGVFSIAAGWVTDRYGPRIAMAIFGLLAGLGLFLTSQVTTIWQIYISYGLIFGIGMSVTFNTPFITVSRWFLKRRGLALGIVAAGIGLGTLIWAPVSERLIVAFDWRNAYIVAAVAICLVFIGSARALRRYPQDMGLVPYGQTESPIPSTDSPLNERKAPLENEFTAREAVKTGTFWLLAWGRFFFNLCLQMVMLHLVPYATDREITPLVAATFLGVLGASSTIGRLVMGAVSDRIGGKNSQALCWILVTMSMFLLLVTSEPWMFYLFAIIFGFSYGGSVPQHTSLPSEYFGMHSLGTIIGIEWSLVTAGGAIGAWLGGLVFDITESYHLAFVIGIIAMLAALLFTLLLRKPEKLGG